VTEGRKSIDEADTFLCGLPEMAAAHRAVQRQASMLGMSHHIHALGNSNDVSLVMKAGDNAADMTDDTAIFMLRHCHMESTTVIFFKFPAPKMQRLSVAEHTLEKSNHCRLVPVPVTPDDEIFHWAPRRSQALSSFRNENLGSTPQFNRLDDEAKHNLDSDYKLSPLHPLRLLT
jgi:hypothetical protein